ncbi:hypothetical protein ACLMJK_007899 [Lecanora helva]
MPPPLSLESDAESVADEIPHKAKEEPTDTKMKEEENEEEDDDEEEDEYIVEAIKDHNSNFKDGEMRYYVKWKGYENEAEDNTWETEESFGNARDLLEAYWKSIGGKPTPAAPKSAKKRGRQSTEAKKEDNTKRQKTTAKRGRKSNGALEQDRTPTPLIGYTEVGDDDWKPPPANEGAWDPLVQSVDTVMREGEYGSLWGYVIWNHKNEDGRFYRSKAKITSLYRACPQRMLHFYEKHLVFSNTAPEVEDKAPE